MQKSINRNDGTSSSSFVHTARADDLLQLAVCDLIVGVEDLFLSFHSNNVLSDSVSSEEFPVYNANSGMVVSSCFDERDDTDIREDNEWEMEDQGCDFRTKDYLVEADAVITSEASNVDFYPMVRGRAYSDSVSQELDGMSRPFLIYSQVIKESPKSSVGISFSTKRIRVGDAIKVFVSIKDIQDDGLFGRRNGFCLQSGDEVISVNNRSAIGLNASQVAKLLRLAPGNISLTVRNPTGDPRLFYNSVQKPSPESMVGVALTNKTHGHALYVSRVDIEGLFAGSLLMPGHQCLMINGVCCRNVPSEDAVKIIHSRTNNSTTTNPEPTHQQHVTILSRPPSRKSVNATVLSSDEAKCTWKRNVLNKLGFQKIMAVALNVTNTEIVAIAIAVDGIETQQPMKKHHSNFVARLQQRTQHDL